MVQKAWWYRSLKDKKISQGAGGGEGGEQNQDWRTL